MIATLITFVVAFVVSGYVVNHSQALALWQRWEQRLSPALCVILAAFVYCVVLGGVAMLRHWSFNSNALDMGLMDQIVWNTLQGRWFEESFIAGVPASFLAHHFSPALALLVPFYWLLARPETLIVVQVLCIVGSAILLYLVAIRLTAQVWVAVTLALMILLHPLVQDAALFDFHQDAIGMLFLTLGLFGISTRRWGLALIGWLVSLLAKEEVAVYWIVIGIFYLVIDRHCWIGKAIFIAVNVVYLYITINYLMPYFQVAEHGEFSFFERYAFWGGSIGEAFGTIVGDSIGSAQNLLLPNRIGGLGMMLLPVLLFLVRGQWALLVLLLPLAINSLSDSVGQHNYRFHYSLLPIVIIVYASIWAARSIQQRGGQVGGAVNSTHLLQRAMIFMVVASLMLFVGVSQIGLRLPTTLQNYLIDDHDRLGYEVMTHIPDEASLVAQNKLVAHLSQRRYITLFSRLLAHEPDYYFLDMQSPTAPQTAEQYVTEVTALLANRDYGVVHLEDGYILLERGARHDEADVTEAMTQLEQFFPEVTRQE